MITSNFTQSLKYGLSYYHAVDHGDHGKRNERSFGILMDILIGHNTSEELKDIYSHKMTFEEAKERIKEMRDRSDEFYRIFGSEPPHIPLFRGWVGPSGDPITRDDLMNEDAIEYQESHNKEKRISKKAVDYHLRRLVKEGLIVKRKGRYYPNYRSAKAVRTILELMQSARNDLLDGFHRLMDVWASLARVEIKDVIADPEGMRDRFTEYTTEFMSYPRNMRDFYQAWTVPIVYGHGVKARKEFEARYRDHYDRMKHYFNWEAAAKSSIEKAARNRVPPKT